MMVRVPKDDGLAWESPYNLSRSVGEVEGRMSG